MVGTLVHQLLMELGMEMDRGLVDGQDSWHCHTHKSMDGSKGDSRGGFWMVEG